MFFLQLLIFLLVLVSVVLVISIFIGIPFLPTRRRQARLMMELAGVKERSEVVDLGSGAGRLLFLAAKKGAHAVGYELNPFLVWWTRLLILIQGLKGKVEVRCRSLYDADLSRADIVFAFLLNRPMKNLEYKLFSQVKAGGKIVSNAFPIPNRLPTIKKEKVYVYEVGANS